MSNCVVGSGGSWLPCSTIAEHSVEGCDHFSHDGDDPLATNGNRLGDRKIGIDRDDFGVLENDVGRLRS